MNNNTIYSMIVILLIAVLSFTVYLLLRRKRDIYLPVDELEGHDFEYYCADLLKLNGFSEVEVTKGSGDFGVDILALKDGISYAFQCKCYDRPIGVKAVQEIYSGRDFYGCMVGVVLTNQYFTGSAKEMAEKLKILLWDRDKLNEMELRD
ncbi:MAG: restriction endonuclease [Lachnospiraceae bacterium]|nr:restriction endonuclease [Lachnospiraceae bacterium]